MKNKIRPLALSYFELYPKMAAYVVLLVFSVLCILPEYLFGLSGHDSYIHGLWTKHFAQGLAEGNLYPRLANDIFGGFGSFVFMFYPPVSFYLNSIFAFAGNDHNYYYPVLALAANFALFLSGCAAYCWLETRIGKGEALLCSMMYMVLPLHLFIDLYVTASIAQFWCYVWFPLVMLATEKISRAEKYGVPLLAASSALLVMTNIPAALLFLIFAAAYGMVICRPAGYHLLAFAYLLGAGLSAVYALPMMAYKELVDVDGHWEGFFHYSNFFIDKGIYRLQGQESSRFTLALAALITAWVAVAFISKMQKGRVKVFLACSAAVSFFLCLSISNFLWEALPIARIVHFPRRLLIIPTVIIVLAAAALLAEKKDYMREAVAVAVILLALAILPFKLANDYFFPVNEAFIDKFHGRQYEFFSHYLPREGIWEAIDIDNKAVKDYPRAQISEGKVEVKKWESGKIRLVVSGGAGARLKIRQFLFPGWQARLDGEAVGMEKDGGLGIMVINLPREVEGGVLKMDFRRLPAEKWGNAVSLAALLVLGLVIRRERRKV